MSLLRRSPFFTADVEREFARYWDEAGEQIAWRFETAVEQTLHAIARRPDIGRKRDFRHPTLQQLRSFRVEPPFRRFLIFYRVEVQSIEVGA